MSEARTIVALDLATTTGCAELDDAPDARPRFYSVRFASPGDEHTATFARARRWIDGRLSVGDVKSLYVEAPLRMGAMAGQTNADTVLRLNGLWAVISAAAGVWRVKYRDVNVQEARRVFLGSGTLRRDDAKSRAMQMARAIGWEPNTLDEADAAAVLYLAMTKERCKAAPPISPMLHHRIATAAENAKSLAEQQKRERRLRA